MVGGGGLAGGWGFAWGCSGACGGCWALKGERERCHKDQYATIGLTSAAAVFKVWLREELLTKTVLGAGVGPAVGAAGVL